MAILQGYPTTTYITSKTLQPISVPQKKQISEPALSVPAPKPATQELPTIAPAEDKITVAKSDKRFALRLTTSQRSKIKQLRKDWNLSTDAAVIKKLIDTASKEKPTQEKALQVEELTAIRNELNRIGININQIAHKANQFQMSQDDLKSFVTYVNKILVILYRKGGL